MKRGYEALKKIPFWEQRHALRHLGNRNAHGIHSGGRGLGDSCIVSILGTGLCLRRLPACRVTPGRLLDL